MRSTANSTGLEKAVDSPALVSSSSRKASGPESLSIEAIYASRSGRPCAPCADELPDEGEIVQRDGESAFEAYGPDDAKDAEIRRRHAAAARRLFPDL